MIVIDLYMDGEVAMSLDYDSFEALYRDMGDRLGIDEFDGVDDVVDFLNDQDADVIRDAFYVSITTRDWQFVAA